MYLRLRVSVVMLWTIATFVGPQNMVLKWEVPVFNDTYVMLFFGILKKLVGKWMALDSNKVG